MSARPLVVVGDALLDRDVEGRVERLCPDAPVPVVDETGRNSRPGGAGLAAALAVADGHRVILITALADDLAGHEIGALLAKAGVEIVNLELNGSTPEKVRILTNGRCLIRLDRGSTLGAVGLLTDAARYVLRSASAILVSDYGRGMTSEEGIRAVLSELSPRTPIVWDPHPRGTRPVPGVRLATPNRAEAAAFAANLGGESLPTEADQARKLAARWRATGVAVTLGAEGAVYVEGVADPVVVPAPKVTGGDVCGAGDSFASKAAGLLAKGSSTAEAVVSAVLAASGFVAAGGAAGASFGQRRQPESARFHAAENAEQVIEQVRAKGGTVVATGGCFDLLHAGHVHTLQAARALGDCLVVCLNSDASVRRIKGFDRPLVPEEDRVAVLRALGCVDAVVLFDEDTPEAVLERLRPDVFAKGGDYAVAELLEARLLSRWGGRAVILPYVAGRSTTRLIEEAVSRNAH